MREHQDSRDSLGLERIVFFSDAVFAIAMTLLAIDLRLPEITVGREAEELPRSIVAIWPRAFSFLISFLVVA